MLSTLNLLHGLISNRAFDNHHVGVFAANELPVHVELPAALIVNTDPKDSPGKHWVAIYIDSNSRGEFFDSYGKPPHVHNHLRFLENNSKFYTYNTHQIQSYGSVYCGHYCFLYLFHRASGKPMHKFQILFPVPIKNDNIISTYLLTRKLNL